MLLACPPEEHHTFGLALLQLILRRRGFSTVNLGGNVPLEEMEKTVQKTRPDLVILSAQQLHSAGKLLEMSEVILRQNVPVAFGGRVFNASESVREGIPGHFLGTDLLGGRRAPLSACSRARPLQLSVPLLRHRTKPPLPTFSQNAP